MISPALKALVIAAASVATVAALRAQSASFTVTVVPPVHGHCSFTRLAGRWQVRGRHGRHRDDHAGPGYALDSAWYSVPGRFGQMYHEGMTREQFKVTIDQDKRIGASFIEAAAVNHVVVTHDVLFAKPGVKALKYDVFSPEGRAEPADHRHHPWRRLDGQRRGRHARPGPRADEGRPVRGRPAWTIAGPARPTAMPPATRWPNLIEDVFGGIAHIMEHAAAVRRRSDPDRRDRRQRRRTPRRRWRR